MSSATGWLGHYKPHDLIPMNADEYILVNSYGGFPHIQVINKELNTADWRTSGDFEVRVPDEITDFYLIASFHNITGLSTGA